MTLFSPNSLNVSNNGLAALAELGVTPPNPSEFPTGKEFVQGYLDHISTYLRKCSLCDLRLRTLVTSIGRGNKLKGELGESREKSQFRVFTVYNNDEEEIIDGLDIIVDATGTYGNHNWLGLGGIPAKGEKRFENEIMYTIPIITKEKFLGTEESKVNLVVGSGASAITTLSMLEKLNRDTQGKVF